MKFRFFVKPGTVILLLMKKGWTQERLAKEMSVSAWTVSVLLNQKQSPSPDTMTRLSRAFRGMSVKKGGRTTWDDLFEARTEGGEG